jgi:Putative beta-barrel porin-2, OmpL-like. bbp2
MLRKIISSLLFAAFLTPVFAQDSAKAVTEEAEAPKGFTISGTADMYYRYDFAKTKANNFTSFTNSHNQFQLGMASVKLEQNFSKVSMVADIGVGTRAEDFSYNDEGTMAAIKQLYISVQATDWLKLTAGSWGTHVGYELVDPMANRNYSMSYMFSYGPFFHTGLKAEIKQGNHGFMVGIANPTDFKIVPDDMLNKKQLIAQYSFSASEKFAAYLNYVGGEQVDSSKGQQFDLVLTSKLTGKFGIGFNGTVNSNKAKSDGKFDDAKSWWGSALYLNFDPSEKLALTLRNEYFSDSDARLMFGAAPDGGSIFASTLSAKIYMGSHFALIPEFRLENASENVFTDSKGAGTKTAANALLAAVFTF